MLMDCRKKGIGWPMNCPFCQLDDRPVLLKNHVGMAFYDSFPVSKGHSLIVPRDHVRSFFDLPKPELTEIWGMVARIRLQLLEEFEPDGFNIGINEGSVAGQTVGHAHIHIIPRYSGDVSDPRGGVRWVIPDKADYWTKR
jgi:diadenosine tetraphosphate (Ap4A) HIT family hydrolase